MKPIEIYVADDHKMFTDGIESILLQETEISILGAARNGLQLLALQQNHPADVVLLDISMPEMDGEETAARLLKEFPQTKILMLTMHNAVEYIVPLVKMGVHGYLLKNTDKTELINAIKSIHQSGQYFSGEIAQKLAASIRHYDDKQVKLTHRELEVLQLVFDGLSTVEISEKLYLSPRTVETHRSNLLNKTECKNTAQLINYALKNGLVNTDQ
jgi:DNA-binding NarL/FixJ family response regulator